MNLFGKKTEEPQYSEVITMVHKEFESAGEKLYQEALSIINSSRLLNEEKVQRLKKLGFSASKEVTDAEEVLNKRKLNKELVERIAYFKTNYPLNKFITEDQVKEICGKYGLIYGKISQYTGFIPENKLRDIEKFKLSKRDRPWLYKFGNTWFAWEKLIEPNMYGPHMGWYEYNIKYYKPSIDVGVPDNNYTKYGELEFVIAAPAKDFNITNRDEIKEFKIMNKPVPDPVVLAPVNGGYLIVTAWGDEASDPIIQNEINN